MTTSRTGRCAKKWPVVITAAALTLFAIGCGGAGVGEACDESSDCANDLVCDPVTRVCTDPGAPTDSGPGTDALTPGTDATASTDATPGSDAVPGTDATTGTDAAPATDATPGTDAAPATDGGTGVCTLPLTTSSPVSCFQACDPGDSCVWAEDDCCPCNMGGTNIAINATHSAIWNSRRALMCPGPPPICLAVFNCEPGTPSCVGGVCQ